MNDYERGFKDGQDARKYENARRDYERGYRDGYGWPTSPYVTPYVYPAYPLPNWTPAPWQPTCGSSGTLQMDFQSPQVTCTFN